jgi:hypothetical protein
LFLSWSELSGVSVGGHLDLPADDQVMRDQRHHENWWPRRPERIFLPTQAPAAQVTVLVHNAVVAWVRSGGAGDGGIAAQHLRGCQPVGCIKASLGAPVKPSVAEMRLPR